MFAHLTTQLHNRLGRQYSISAFMKQDNITEMHIYMKYEIVSFVRRQFSSLKVIYKLVKIEKSNKQKTKVGICTKTVSVCHFDDGLCHT